MPRPSPTWLSSVALLVLVACSSTQVSSVDVPLPLPPLSLGLALTDDANTTPRQLGEASISGVLEVAEQQRDTGDLRLVVRDGTRLVTATLPPVLDPRQIAPWSGLAVRLEAARTPTGTDLELRATDDGRLLLMIVSRRYAERLPGRPEDWGTPLDLPLRRVVGDSVLRTTGDENDCVALSVHYPLEIVGGPTPLRLPRGTWQPATWRGQPVAFLNRDTWWYRRSSCAGLEGAGTTLVVRDAPEMAAEPPAR